MGSARLPGKILMSIGDKPLLGHILKRLERLKHEAIVVIATTAHIRDDAVEAFCKEWGAQCFRGDELNVLKRYYDCAYKYGFTDIVRMTGDNPFPDVEELERMIALHKAHGNDYTECFSSLPVGVGMEMFSMGALAKSLELSTLEHHFEHVDEYILENHSDFRCETMEVPDEKRRPEVRLTVDTKEDYDKACSIVERADGYITTEEAIRLCTRSV